MKWFKVLTADGREASFDVFRTEDAVHAELKRLTAEYPGEMQGGKIAVHAEAPSRLFVTDAPEDYDGFGTYTVEHLPAPHEGFRVVDIADEHARWQIGRNMSGMHATVPIEQWRAEHPVREVDTVSTEDLGAAADMWDRLTSAAGA